MASRLYDAAPRLSGRRAGDNFRPVGRGAADSQDFMAVILVGYGEKMHPFNEGTNVVSKALLPVGNVPIINYVVDWILDAGLRDILVLVPPAFFTAISDAIDDHQDEKYSNTSLPPVRIELKRHTDGEKDEDDEKSDTAGWTGMAEGMVGREGTARLLRRFRSYIRTDFVLLPCDLAPPSWLSLSGILDKHRSRPNAVVTSVLYEPVASVKDGEEKLLVAMDKETEELLLIQPFEGMEDDLELRMSLIASHPTLSLTTRLLDAHIYVFRRTILDLLVTRRPRDLDSMREQVISWIAKGGWQKGLQERWAPILNPPRHDPFAAALARSTTAPFYASHSFAYPTPESSPHSDHTPLPGTGSATPSPTKVNRRLDTTASATSARLPRKTNTTSDRSRWLCQVIVAAPDLAGAPSITTKSKQDKNKVVPVIEHLVRANSLAGYWEINRRVLKNLAPAAGPSRPQSSQPQSTDDTSASAGPISPSAQLSPDSLIGKGTRIGDRASIKKCVVGRHCNIGRGAKITNSILWDFVTVEENARIENAILCSNVRIGEKAQVKDCEFGTGYEAKPGAVLKGERLVAGQEA